MVDALPVKEDELDGVVDIPWKKLFESMEDGKYYSINEMSQRIIGREIIGSEALKKYLDTKGRKKVPMQDILPKLTGYVRDVAYVDAVLVALVTVCKLKMGLKDGFPYFCKK